MTRREYRLLKESGMMWEFNPEFVGDYNVDILGEEQVFKEDLGE